MADIILKSEPAYVGDLIGDLMALNRLEAHLARQQGRDERPMASLKTQRKVFRRQIFSALLQVNPNSESFKQVMDRMVPTEEQAAYYQQIDRFYRQLEQLIAS